MLLLLLLLVLLVLEVVMMMMVVVLVLVMRKGGKVFGVFGGCGGGGFPGAQSVGMSGARMRTGSQPQLTVEILEQLLHVNAWREKERERE